MVARSTQSQEQTKVTSASARLRSKNDAAEFFEVPAVVVQHPQTVPACKVVGQSAFAQNRQFARTASLEQHRREREEAYRFHRFRSGKGVMMQAGGKRFGT